MTPAEYIQLKAFARVEGVILALWWTVSFACYIIGLTNQLAGFIAILLIALTPVFVGRRLKMFRDHALSGVISFKRAWAFVILVFFYGSLLFALAVYAYFAYLDQGYLLQSIEHSLAAPETARMMEQYQMTDFVKQALSEMEQVRPIDIAINMLSTNLVVGVLVGLPVALLMMTRKQAS